MKPIRSVLLVLVTLSALSLTACSGPNELAQAHEECLQAALEKLPIGTDAIDTSRLETSDLSSAIAELVDSPLPPREDASTMYSTTGEIWYRKGASDVQVGVLCLSSYVDGELTEPVTANVTPK